MQTPAFPPDENERLQQLYRYEILDSAPESAFDELVQVAATVCAAPIALVSLVDLNRQWFKARIGLVACETDRAVSFCGHVVAARAPLVIDDTLLDERFADNPLVTGEPRLRFYAGFPLVSPSGHVLGTLCVADTEARSLSEPQREVLAGLARTVVNILELRRDARQREQQEQRLRAVERSQRRYLGAFNHDMRTPLTAILGITEHLLEPDLSGDDRRQELVRLRDRAQELQRRLVNALTLAELEPAGDAPTGRSVEIRPWLKEVASDLRHHVETGGARLTVAIADSVPARIELDGQSVRAALVSLVLSALEAEPADGADVRRGDARCDTHRPVRIAVETDGRRLTFAVGPISSRVFEALDTAASQSAAIIALPAGFAAAASIVASLAGELRGRVTATGHEVVLDLALREFRPLRGQVVAVAVEPREAGQLIERFARQLGAEVFVVDRDKLASLPRPPSAVVVASEHLELHGLPADARVVALANAGEIETCRQLGADGVIAAPVSSASVFAALSRN